MRSPDTTVSRVKLHSGTTDTGKPQFVTAGASVQTYLYAALNNDSFLDLSDTVVTYSSNREDVATVSEDGLITALQEGVVTITASIGYSGETMTGECVLKVTAE